MYELQTVCGWFANSSQSSINFLYKHFINVSQLACSYSVNDVRRFQFSRKSYNFQKLLGKLAKSIKKTWNCNFLVTFFLNFGWFSEFTGFLKNRLLLKSDPVFRIEFWVLLRHKLKHQIQIEYNSWYFLIPTSSSRKTGINRQNACEISITMRKTIYCQEARSWLPEAESSAIFGTKIMLEAKSGSWIIFGSSHF